MASLSFCPAKNLIKVKSKVRVAKGANNLIVTTTWAQIPYPEAPNVLAMIGIRIKPLRTIINRVIPIKPTSLTNFL